MSPEGNPPALPEDSRSLIVPTMVWLVGLEYDPFPFAPALSFGLSITHIFRPARANPKGILSFSPGLRGTSYPGVVIARLLKGL